MHLLNVETIQLEYFSDSSRRPRYAILSHTWGDEEVSFRELTEEPSIELQHKKGYSKIVRTCSLARKSGVSYARVDTCCIDKDSSAELSEAINSIFVWYEQADICYAFLSDVTARPTERIPANETKSAQLSSVTGFLGSRWFTRG